MVSSLKYSKKRHFQEVVAENDDLASKKVKKVKFNDEVKEQEQIFELKPRPLCDLKDMKEKMSRIRRASQTKTSLR